MIPAFLITFREVIEATLIVATILGILYKLDHRNSINTVWYATTLATILSVSMLLLGSIFGYKMQELYQGHTEEIIEGTLMFASVIFITWAVFFLHNYFGKQKLELLQKVKKTIELNEQKGLFLMVFTAIIREGFEIVLFLSTIYLSSDPAHVFVGFGFGLIGGLFISLILFSATLKMPVYYAFRVTSVLLMLFAAGLLTRAVHEFAEFGIIPEIGELFFSFIPEKGSFIGDVIKSFFGITQKMDLIQLAFYFGYLTVMSWLIFGRNNKIKTESPLGQTYQ